MPEPTTIAATLDTLASTLAATAAEVRVIEAANDVRINAFADRLIAIGNEMKARSAPTPPDGSSDGTP
jgi:hypothetical protein